MKIQPTNDLVIALRNEGYLLIAGVDEVGRGCLAGPVTAGAVVLPAGTMIEGVYDSKIMSSKSRRKAAREIKRKALAVGIGWSSPQEVDEKGLTWAVRKACERALLDMGIKCDMVLVDGNFNYLKDIYPSRAYVKADALELCVAAASVIAKEARDSIMRRYSICYPVYSFHTNMGYGTQLHRKALKAGPVEIHRRLFLKKLNQTETSSNAV